MSLPFFSIRFQYLVFVQCARNFCFFIFYFSTFFSVRLSLVKLLFLWNVCIHSDYRQLMHGWAGLVYAKRKIERDRMRERERNTVFNWQNQRKNQFVSKNKSDKQFFWASVKILKVTHAFANSIKFHCCSCFPFLLLFLFLISFHFILCDNRFTFGLMISTILHNSYIFVLLYFAY